LERKGIAFGFDTTGALSARQKSAVTRKVRRYAEFPPFLSWCPEGKETLRYEVPGEGMV